MNLLKILQENRLLKTPQEIKLFEETLEKIAKYPKDDNLKELFRDLLSIFSLKQKIRKNLNTIFHLLLFKFIWKQYFRF